MAIMTTLPPENSGGVSYRYSSFVYIVSAIVAFGGLLFGFDLVIISGTVSFFSRFFQLDAGMTGWAVGCINIGAALGAIISGKLSDVVGRKKLLLICAFLFAVTGFATGWATDFTFFVCARILSGVAIGVAALICPIYIAEIAPGPIRGRLVAFYQLAIVAGLLMAYLSNYLLLNTGINNWRWMFSAQSAPAILFFTGLFFLPESPRWLIKQNRIEKALEVLQKMGGKAYAVAEMDAIIQSFNQLFRSSVRDLFKPGIAGIIFVGIAVAVFSQADGQNSLFCYAPVIFKQAGAPDNSAFLQAVVLGAVNFLCTFIAIHYIDRAGRRKLLLYGSMLLCLDASALAACFYSSAPGYMTLVFVLGFIGIYAATLGPVTWVLLSEIFPNRVRGYAMGLATLSLWIADFFTTASFPLLKKEFGLPVTFLIHALICLIYFLFVKLRVPETKGRTLEEIENQLTRTSPET